MTPDGEILAALQRGGRATGQIARALGLPAYSDERVALRSSLIDLRRRGLVRQTPHPAHGVWSLTRAGETESRRRSQP